MISSKNRNYMRATLYVLMTALILSIAGINKAQAFQKKSTDTVSTSDVQFTAIPTTADSIAARKKAARGSGREVQTGCFNLKYCRAREGKGFVGNIFNRTCVGFCGFSDALHLSRCCHSR